MSELGSLLKKLRGKESLRDASKRSGVSHNYLSLLEKGTDPRTKAPIKPSPETLKKLAEAYNYSYEELMNAAGYLDESSEYNKEEEQFMIDLSLTDEELMKKYKFVDKDKEYTDEEFKTMLSIIRNALSLRKK